MHPYLWNQLNLPINSNSGQSDMSRGTSYNQGKSQLFGGLLWNFLPCSMSWIFETVQKFKNVFLHDKMYNI